MSSSSEFNWIQYFIIIIPAKLRTEVVNFYAKNYFQQEVPSVLKHPQCCTYVLSSFCSCSCTGYDKQVECWFHCGGHCKLSKTLP